MTLLQSSMLFNVVFFIMLACDLSSKSPTYTSPYTALYAATASSDLLAESSITASISRKLAFPDFKDDEKTGAITLLGSAEIDKSSGTINIPATTRKSNSSIQAPKDWSHTAGRALYSFPFRMMDPIANTTASFHTSFSFQMRNTSEFDDSANKSDSGLTFLVVPDELTVGRNGGWLGMMNDACDDTYRPFAVEFDTFKNEEFQDPNDHHVGINYGSIVSKRTADISDAGISLRNGDPTRAWISYDSAKHLVDVRLAKDGAEKPTKPLLVVPLDLSEIFKEYMFVGFSGGASGSSIHTILSWHFSSDSTGLLRFPKQESCIKRLLPPIQTRTSRAPSAFIIFCLVMLVLGLAVINFACIPYNKKRGEEVSNAVKLMRLAREKPRPVHQPRKYSLFEILEASRLFNEGEIIGNGENGIFYNGLLQDSSQVAIKRYSSAYVRRAFTMSSGKRKIEKEINKFARVHHPNLLSLRGWCLDKGEILLVYEYMPNGSLDQWLFSQGSIFPWVRRYKIVKELAGALAFLHTGFEKPIVHKNVKLSNILLDITFRAKLGDYGLCKKEINQGINNQVECSINFPKVGLGSPRRMKGCMPSASFSILKKANKVINTDMEVRDMKNSTGKLGVENGGDDMEYTVSTQPNGLMKNEGSSSRKATTSQWMKLGCKPDGKISERKREVGNEVRRKTKEEDVYSYGVMLFEIVSGRNNHEKLEEEEDLVDWVWNLQEEGRLLEAIDEDLRVGASRYYITWEEEATSVLTIGLLCTLQDPSQRPSMTLISKYLYGEVLLPKVPPRTTILSTQNTLVIYPDHSLDYEDTIHCYSPSIKIMNSCNPL